LWAPEENQGVRYIFLHFVVATMAHRETRANANNGAAPGVAESLARLEAMMKGINTKLDDNVSMLSKSIEDSKIELRDEFRTEIHAKIQANFAAIECNTADITELRADVNRIDDAIDVNNRAADLLVKGIPMLPRENSRAIYQSIATAIGYPNNYAPLAEVFRLGVKKPNTKYDPPLILRFANRIEKNIFHQKYFEMKNLGLNHIGFQTTSRIIISENLTKTYQVIFSAAMKLKHDGKLTRVSTLRGAVYAKPCGKEKSIPIRSLSDLDCFNDESTDD
jgi:hypothetical protein